MMLDFSTAAIIASVLASLPLIIVGRTVYFAMISASRFASTNGIIQDHAHPKNEDGEPIQLRLAYRYSVGDQSYTGRRYYFGSKIDYSAPGNLFWASDTMWSSDRQSAKPSLHAA